MCFFLNVNRHVGDLGNVTAEADNVAKINITDQMLTLNGPLSIIGRTMVVRNYYYYYLFFISLPVNVFGTSKPKLKGLCLSECIFLMLKPLWNVWHGLYWPISDWSMSLEKCFQFLHGRGRLCILPKKLQIQMYTRQVRFGTFTNGKVNSGSNLLMLLLPPSYIPGKVIQVSGCEHINEAR